MRIGISPNTLIDYSGYLRLEGFEEYKATGYNWQAVCFDIDINHVWQKKTPLRTHGTCVQNICMISIAQEFLHYFTSEYDGTGGVI